MLDLILINDDFSRVTPVSYGKATLMTYLIQRGWKVKIIQSDDIPGIRERATRFFGVGSWSVGFGNVVRDAAILKRLYPHIPIICGGGHVSINPVDLKAHAELFDYWVLGDGEMATDEILQGKQRVHVPIIRSIQGSDLVIPTISLNPVVNGFYTMQGSRGCCHSCTFCSALRMFGEKVRIMPVERVFQHIKYVLRCGAITICFTDSSFLNCPHWTTEFCELIDREKIKFNWIASCCAEQLNEKLVVMMKRAGCILLSVGLESGSPAILKAIRKRHGLQDAVNAVQLCKKHGIGVQSYFICGVLGETRETMAATREFYNQCKSDMNDVFLYDPYPGTAMFEEARRQGFLNNYDWSQGVKAELLFTGTMSRKEVLHEAVRLWGKLPANVNVGRVRSGSVRQVVKTVRIIAAKMLLKVLCSDVYRLIAMLQGWFEGGDGVLAKHRRRLIGQIHLAISYRRMSV